MEVKEEMLISLIFFCIYFSTGTASDNEVITDLENHFRSGSNFRIVGGEETTIENYTFVVSVQYKRRHFCGGTLYSRNLVLTAAHCVYDLKLYILEGRYKKFDSGELTVLMGTSFSSMGELPDTGERRGVLYILPHKSFSFRTMENDIALMKLSYAVRLSDTITLVPILKSKEEIPTGTNCIALGWGSSRAQSPVRSAITPEPQLMCVELPVIDLEKCQNVYHKLKLSNNICTYVRGKDACQGDSGGPLMCMDKQFGITSFGKGCAAKGYPGVFQRTDGHVSMQLKRRHYCGGTLYSPNLVLTAAHCVYDSRAYVREGRYVKRDIGDLAVLMGTSYSSAHELPDTGEKRGVLYMLPHDDFSYKTMANDIALLKLSYAVRLSSTITLVPIPITKLELPPGTNCTALGWGSSRPRKPGRSARAAEPQLMLVQLPVFDVEKCKTVYRKINIKNSICTYVKGKDACQGDSGGPLMCWDAQLGVTSFGKGCAARGYPGVFHRVDSHIDWIKATAKRSRAVAASCVRLNRFLFLFIYLIFPIVYFLAFI